MNISRLTSYILLAAFTLVIGCAYKAPPDPLAGWHPASHEPDPVIEKDYQDYIQKSSAAEKKNVSPVEVFEDGTGQHAISFAFGVNGRYTRHILIYDKDNKRIKVIKYKTGWYQS
jgi:hypothetical protein